MSKPQQSSIVALVYLCALTQGLTVVSVPASAGVLKTVLDDASYGASFVPQMLATIAGSLWASRLAARALCGPVLALAMCASGAAEVLLALVPNGGGFACALAATSALGFGFGLSAAALNALPGQLFPRRKDSALVALHTVLAGGFAAGPALASAAMAARRWVAVPLAVSALAFALAAVALVRLPRSAAASNAHAATDTVAAASVRAGASAVLLLAIAVCYALAEGTFANWAVVYLREERALSNGAAALALSTFWFALAVGRLIASALLARISAVAIWRALPVAMALCFLALPSVHDASSAVLAFALAGLSCSAFFPLTVSLATPHFRGGAARASSLLSAALMVGVGLGSFVIGPLREGIALATLYRFSAVYPVIAWGLCSWLLTRLRRSSPQSESAVFAA
jgi:fucose permease